jgi:tRNA nucleotidyltransferase (CCA-adding enzyme)
LNGNSQGVTQIDPEQNSTQWEHFPHEADMGIRGYGSTPSEAYEQAALALTGVITDPEHVDPVEKVEVHCEVDDPELLLVDWLNAVIYEIATRRMLFSRFEVFIDGPRLKGKLWGEAVVVKKHHPAVEVKGATFTSLRVAQEADGRWVAQCVVDV